jgi:hypothetical protein
MIRLYCITVEYASKMSGNNGNKARREASRHFGNKKREYLKYKTNELALNS